MSNSYQKKIETTNYLRNNVLTDVQSLGSKVNVKAIWSDDCERASSSNQHMDLYVAGFPCQPFSSLGKERGDTDNKGKLVHSLIDYIRKSLPNIFCLKT